jgi:hypothetical protein
VRRYVDAGAFIDGLRAGSISLDSRLLHRLTVLAGLEAAGLRIGDAEAYR